MEDDLILDRLVADVGLMIARLREFVGEHPDAGWLLIQRAAARRALEDPDGQRLFNTALAVISCAAPDEGRSPT